MATQAGNMVDDGVFVVQMTRPLSDQTMKFRTMRSRQLMPASQFSAKHWLVIRGKLPMKETQSNILRKSRSTLGFQSDRY